MKLGKWVRLGVVSLLAAIVALYAVAVCVDPKISGLVKNNLENPNFHNAPWGHRDWMLRSYATTFVAVTLRLYLPLLIVLAGGFNAAYRYVSWLAWVPNLIFIELWIRTVSRRAKSRQTRYVPMA